MESSRRRKIKDGQEFDHLFPRPSGLDITQKKRASVDDTVRLIQRTVPLTLWHTEKIAKRLKGKTLEETCSNIWHFVYEHIQYKRDKDGVEQVRSPRRTWWERKTGVDCDCYTEFISSILFNLGIPHKARITKYPKRLPELPRWQHIYPIVPLDGDTSKELTHRDDYIVIDCVKDEYDDEQPFLEAKDYDMQLDYLDGFDDEDEIYEEDSPSVEDIGYEYIYENVDVQGISDLYDEDELGFLKKLRKKIKKAVKKVGSGIKKVAKKVGDAAGKGIRFINRYVNPATVLLRNGFLLAMKQDMMNVAEKLRFGYLSDSQAKAMGMDLNELKKLRKVKDKAETIYWQAGGKKSNLKKAILGGKGNKDKKVQLQGLAGPDDNVYADEDEYNIIHMDMETLEGLGVVETGAIAAATGAVAAIKTALKQVKDLFAKGSGGNLVSKIAEGVKTVKSTVNTVKSSVDTVKSAANEVKSIIPVSTKANTLTLPTTAKVIAQPAITSQEQSAPYPMEMPEERNLPATTNTSEEPTAEEKEGFFQKTTTWVKENPGKTILIAGAAVGGGVLLAKVLSNPKKSVSGLSGTPRRKRKKTTTRRTTKTSPKRRSTKTTQPRRKTRSRRKTTRQKVYAVKL